MVTQPSAKKENICLFLFHNNELKGKATKSSIKAAANARYHGVFIQTVQRGKSTASLYFKSLFESMITFGFH